MNARSIASIIITGIQIFCVIDLSFMALKVMKRADKLEAELKALKDKTQQQVESSN